MFIIIKEKLDIIADKFKDSMSKVIDWTNFKTLIDTLDDKNITVDYTNPSTKKTSPAEIFDTKTSNMLKILRKVENNLKDYTDSTPNSNEIIAEGFLQATKIKLSESDNLNDSDLNSAEGLSKIISYSIYSIFSESSNWDTLKQKLTKKAEKLKQLKTQSPEAKLAYKLYKYLKNNNIESINNKLEFDKFINTVQQAYKDHSGTIPKDLSIKQSDYPITITQAKECLQIAVNPNSNGRRPLGKVLRTLATENDKLKAKLKAIQTNLSSKL